METVRLQPSSFAQIKTFEDLEKIHKNFTNVGFGKKAMHLEDNIPTAVTVMNADKKVPENIASVSRSAKWRADELTRLTKAGASQSQINKIAEVLPMRKLMENALRRGGYPVPPDITDLTTAFYQNIIKKSAVGKHFQHVEGNPILYKMNASALVVSSLVDLVPAATSFVNAAMAKSSEINDPQLIKDANDIKAFIQAKANGLATDNIVIGKTTYNPWLIGGFIILAIVILVKLVK